LNEEKDSQPNNLIKAKDVDKSTANDNSKASCNINDVSDAKQFSHFGVTFFNVTAKWVVTQANNTLENINITATPNRLLAIIGSVGAGKVWFNIPITMNSNDPYICQYIFFHRVQ